MGEISSTRCRCTGVAREAQGASAYCVRRNQRLQACGENACESVEQPRADSATARGGGGRDGAAGARRMTSSSRHDLLQGIQRGSENCPMKAQTVQNITTIREFIHSAGMGTNSKEFQRGFLLDGARRPCSALYRLLPECNREKILDRARACPTVSVSPIARVFAIGTSRMRERKNRRGLPRVDQGCGLRRRQSRSRSSRSRRAGDEKIFRRARRISANSRADPKFSPWRAYWPGRTLAGAARRNAARQMTIRRCETAGECASGRSYFDQRLPQLGYSIPYFSRRR